MPELKTGHKAPDFSLPDNHNSIHNLSDYQGQWLILFFYPKDNTPGCTVEACQFRDNYSDISAINAKIVGINTDSTESHALFTNKQQLPFPLLSDLTGTVSKLYGTLFKLGPIKFCKRHSFIIDPQGNIAKIYRKVTPSRHSQQIMTDLKILQINM
jgi:peroxiredoxin Q/BCP